MKKLIVLLTLIVAFSLFVGCDKKEIDSNIANDNRIIARYNDLKNNISNADRVAISYGVSSYCMVSSDKDTIKTLLDIFNNLSFEPAENKMDFSTMFHIVISTSKNQNITISVDENGVFCVNGDEKYLKVASGTFNYSLIKDIYNKSKNIK